MKLDTSEYYPKSPLDDFKDDNTETHNEVDVKDLEPISPTPPSEPTRKEPEPEKSKPGFIDIVCRLLSWVLVPLMMPVYGIIMIFMLSILDHTSMGAKIAFTLVTFGFNAALPAILIALLKRMGIVHDIGLNEQKERLIPYIITIACMGATAFFMAHKGAPIWMTMFFVGGAVAGVINLIVNFRWKISAHSAAIAGIVAMIIRIMHDCYPQPNVLTWLIIWIVLSGLLGSARVWMGRHTTAQVIAGYIVGFFSVFLITMIR